MVFPSLSSNGPRSLSPLFPFVALGFEFAYPRSRIHVALQVFSPHGIDGIADGAVLGFEFGTLHGQFCRTVITYVVRWLNLRDDGGLPLVLLRQRADHRRRIIAILEAWVAVHPLSQPRDFVGDGHGSILFRVFDIVNLIANMFAILLYLYAGGAKGGKG